MHLLRVKPQHGVAVAGILTTGFQHGMARRKIDGRQEDGAAASLAGSLYDGVAVVVELLAV
jgi:hypothetical protein